MAFSDVAIQGMYDVALKPKLLRALLREHVPDEKHPFTNPSGLSRVVSDVKTLSLLSERVPDSTDQKLIDSWKSAVDAWVNRLTSLISSNMPDKTWAGICLLGLTCQECSSERFLTSYTQWFGDIFPHIQTLSDSHLARVASCAAMSDLFTRLSGSPISKKDGTSLATKLIQPVLKLFNEDASDLEEAICLLCKLINFFPASVSRHYDNVEASIFSRFMSENGSIDLCKKLCHCLAMLPKSRGDDDSWLLMMQKVLLFINNQLTLAFQGLEEETTGNEVVRLLVPPGKDPPPPLGGPTAFGEHSNLAMKRPERVLVSRVSILMSCCSMMLSASYPVQVPVPVRPLIALTKRVLMVDGSLSPSHFMTIMRHEFMCSELPALHNCSLDLLSAIVKGLRSQLLPHVAVITRLLTEYFRTCALPELRIKVYSVMKALLLSMGIGIAIYLVEVVIDNASVDLDFSAHEKSGTYHAAYSKASDEGVQQLFHKKRKHDTSAGSHEEEYPTGGLAMERSQNLTPVSVRIAALEVLEALLTVAGALRSDSWRSKVDHLIITVASNACKWGFTDDRSTTVYGEATPSRQDLQLAALRALLASLLSPGRVHPPYLAESLELFHKGTQETGTKIAEYCQHALLALEVLIHPRALPLVDFQSFVDDYDGASLKLPVTYSSNHGKNPSFLDGTKGKQPSRTHYNDDLYERWVGNGKTEVGFINNTGTDEGPTGTSGNLPVSNLPSGIEVGEPGQPVAITADNVAGDRDEMIVKSMTWEIDHIKGRNLPVAAETDIPVSGSVSSNYKDLANEVSEKQERAPANDTDDKTEAPTSTRDMAEIPVDGCNKIVEKISAALVNAEKYAGRISNAEKTTATTSDAEKGKGVMVEVDDDEYIPDIVDGDPDSE